MNDELEHLLSKYPDLMCTQDLIDMGLYTDHHTAMRGRRSGKSPKFIKMTKKYLYPKTEVIRFIRENLNEGH